MSVLGCVMIDDGDSSEMFVVGDCMMTDRLIGDCGAEKDCIMIVEHCIVHYFPTLKEKISIPRGGISKGN